VADLERFIDACRRVTEGGSVLDPEVVCRMLSRRSNGPLDQLTRQEQQVLALMAEGRCNHSIAEARHQQLRQARAARDGRRPSAGAGRPCTSQRMTPPLVPTADDRTVWLAV
jgi:FixJ family two-component response regulator